MLDELFLFSPFARFERAVVTYLKFFPESLFRFLRIVCYFVELLYPVLNVGCVYPCRVKGLLFDTFRKGNSISQQSKVRFQVGFSRGFNKPLYCKNIYAFMVLYVKDPPVWTLLFV